MSLLKGFTDELKATAAVAPLGIAADELLDSQVTKVGKFADSPIRLYAAFPTPDSKLYFRASTIPQGDGSSRVIPAIDDKLTASVDGSLDFQTASPTIAGITLTRDSVAYTHPAADLTNKFVRVAFVRKADGSFDSKATAAQTSLGAAQAFDPGTLWGAMDGLANGFIDLECTSASPLKFKTAGSATDIIENSVSASSRIFNVGTGGGSGGADRTYKITSFTATGCVIKGGYERVPGVGVLASGTGTTDATAKADITVSLNTILTNSGLAALGTINSASAIRLTLVLDMIQLGSKTVLTDSLRQVYLWTEAMLRLSTLLPEQIDPRRYVVLDEVYIPQTVTVWTTGVAVMVPTRGHDVLSAYFPYAEPYSNQITSGSGLQTFNHNLSAEPQIVIPYYFDGTNKYPIDPSNVVVHKSATQLKVNVDSYDVTGGKYIEIKAFFIPGMPAIAGSSRTFTSGWMTDTATTTLPHGLTDQEDIRGYEVQEWNTVTGKYRNIDRSAVVKEFDATNFTLEWTGVTPSATLKYRVVAGGSPLPWAIPSEFGGFTKFVKHGPGSYATMTEAFAAAVAGDRILVFGDTSESADLSVPAGVSVVQMPNTTVALAGGLTNGVRFVGAKGKWKDMNVQLSPTGAMAKGISIEAADCWVDGWVELATAQTLTDAVNVGAGGVRTSVEIGVKKTLGTITNLETNADGAGRSQIWGG